MSITIHSEDILPEIQCQPAFGAATPVGAPAAAQGSELAIARDVGGCFSLIGPVEICWSLNIGVPSASIALKVFGVTVMSGEISPARPCLTLKGDYGLAKWDLGVCLRLPDKKITLEGKACFAGKCAAFNVTLFQWGAEAPRAEIAGSTRIQVKNSSDVTVCAKIQMGAIYGVVALNAGDTGQMPCEWVWYTLDIHRHGTHQLLTQLTGVYGGKNMEVRGSAGNYSLHYV